MLPLISLRSKIIKIIASTMTVNHASRRALEKLGLQHIRTIGADWENHILGGKEGQIQCEFARLRWDERSTRSAPR